MVAYRILGDLHRLQEIIEPLRWRYERMLRQRDCGNRGSGLKSRIAAAFHVLSDLEEDEAWLLFRLRRKGIFSRHQLRIRLYAA